jgi:hypothetical protein
MLLSRLYHHNSQPSQPPASKELLASNQKVIARHEGERMKSERDSHEIRVTRDEDFIFGSFFRNVLIIVLLALACLALVLKGERAHMK